MLLPLYVVYGSTGRMRPLDSKPGRFTKDGQLNRDIHRYPFRVDQIIRPGRHLTYESVNHFCMHSRCLRYFAGDGYGKILPHRKRNTSLISSGQYATRLQLKCSFLCSVIFPMRHLFPQSLNRPILGWNKPIPLDSQSELSLHGPGKAGINCLAQVCL